MTTKALEVYEWNQAGYKPLVCSHDWMVALLNFEENMEAKNATQIEHHVDTDEVFILLKGKAAFYLVADQAPLEVIEMKAGLVYNVPRGVWHNLLATKEAVFAIIENRGTDKEDTEIRSMTDAERKTLFAHLPVWAK